MLKKLGIIPLFLFCQSIYGQVAMDWLSISQTVNKNVNSLAVFNSQLVVGGEFDSAGVIKANRIASWNGTAWSTFGSGIKSPASASVFKTIVYNNELYVAGNFDSAGTVACKDIAKWNGSTWSGFSTGSDSIIYAMAFYNNELYVAGKFNNIGGVSAVNIAKWNGSSWQALGSGIPGIYVTDLLEFQNELYAVGDFTVAGGNTCNYIARWNGTNWNAVSGGLNDANLALTNWSNKLIIGSNLNSPNSDMKEWNGSTLTNFSQQPLFRVRTFCEFNTELWCAGGLQTFPGGSNVAKWNSSTSTWSIQGSGVNNYIRGLCVYNNELYCGGRFRTTSGGYHNYIAKWGVSTGLINYENKILNVSFFPNPVKDKLTLEFGTKNLKKITITNTLGQIVFELNSPLAKQEIDLGYLNCGVYVFNALTEKDQVYCQKLIKSEN